MMRWHTWMAAMTAAICLGQGAVLSADTVWLADGSKLVGEVVSAGGGKVALKTDFAGDISVDAAKIKGLSTDAKRVINLAGGDRITGQLSYSDAGGQKLEGTPFGAIDLKLAEVTGLWAPGAPAPESAPVPEQVAQQAQVHAQEVAQIKQQHETEVKALEERYQKAKAAWTARIELGLSGQAGNTEQFTFNGRAEARRTTDRDRLLMFIDRKYDKQEGERSKNETSGGVELEVDISPRWFVFGKGFLESDEFEDLDLRARVSAGVGYFVIKEETQELKLRGGVGYQHESFDDGTSADDAVLELGYDYKAKLNDRMQFVHGVTYYPTFNTVDDYRLVADTALEIALNDKDDWKLKLGMRNEFDNEPVSSDVERLDTFYFLNLVLDIK